MLLARHLRHDPADPAWPDRDRLFVATDMIPPSGTDAIQLDAPHGYAAAASVGAALAERMLAAKFGRSLVDHRTWLLAGRHELMAGAMLEAAAVAGAASLARLTFVATIQPQDAALLPPFGALGWAVRRVAASDAAAFEAALSASCRAQKPTLIACFGDAAPAGDNAPNPRSPGARRAWLKRRRRHNNAELFTRLHAHRLPPGGIDALAPHGATAAASPAEAVRGALPRLAAAWPELAGLNLDGFFAAASAAFPGRAVAWGERTLAISGGLLGMALHGGVLPVADLGRSGVEAALPALRIAADQGLRLICLLHETAPLADGLLAALRAMPDARLFRPADANEALECLALALRHVSAPSLLLLGDHVAEPGSAPARACARGAYVAHDTPHRDVTLIASGADLALAHATRAALREAGFSAACVSFPASQLLALQDPSYRDAVLGRAPRILLQAGPPVAWHDLLGDTGACVDTRSPEGVLPAILRMLRNIR